MSLTYRTTPPPPKKKKIIINKVHQLCRLWNSGFPPTKRTTRENSVGRLSYSTREEAPKSPSFDYNRSKSSLEHRHRHRPKILLLKKCNLAPNIEPWRQASRAQKKKTENLNVALLSQPRPLDLLVLQYGGTITRNGLRKAVALGLATRDGQNPLDWE